MDATGVDEAGLVRARNTADPSTLSNYQQAAVTHMNLELSVDFEANVIRGKVTYDVKAMTDGVEELLLDTRHLEVFRAGSGTDVISGEGVEELFGGTSDADPLGRALHLPLGACLAAGETTQCWTEYSTTLESSAVQFLTRDQTADKRAPFLFTQCQAIHARSLLPCQDTPGLKCPFTASVTVPEGLTALVSALSTGASETSDGSSTFRFEQTVPVPSYLIAIAAGVLEERPIAGEATMSVWAEPSVVEAAAAEFVETPDFVRAAERIMGPYEWGRYDLLVLPPTFPYGGMENPCLTFVTPTLLAGDKSLADVVAHEICHSWSGNLVTCCTWEHFWLNEGATMMAQRLIVADVSEASPSLHWGELRGAKNFHFDAAGGEEGLSHDCCHFCERGQQAYTLLVPNLNGVDPDDVFSRVPYEKGFLLFDAIRRASGSLDSFKAWFRAWFQDKRRTSVNSQDLKDHVIAYFLSPADGHEAVDMASAVDWSAWFCNEGTAPVSPLEWHDGGIRDRCEALADAWASGKEEPGDGTEGWAAGQTIRFLSALLDKADTLRAGGKRLPLDTVVRLTKALSLDTSGNCEIRFRWLCLRVAAADVLPSPDGSSTGCWDEAAAFLRAYGRMKYVRPLFTRLLKDADARHLATALALELGPFYHPICAKVVANDVEVVCAKPALGAADLEEALVKAEHDAPVPTADDTEEAGAAAEQDAAPATEEDAAPATEEEHAAPATKEDAAPATEEEDAAPATEEEDAAPATEEEDAAPATEEEDTATEDAAPKAPAHALAASKSFAPGGAASATAGTGTALGPSRTAVTAGLRRDAQKFHSADELTKEEAGAAKALAASWVAGAKSGAGPAGPSKGGLAAFMERELDGPAAAWTPILIAGACVATAALFAVFMARRVTASE